MNNMTHEEADAFFYQKYLREAKEKGLSEGSTKDMSKEQVLQWQLLSALYKWRLFKWGSDIFLTRKHQEMDSY